MDNQDLKRYTKFKRMYINQPSGSDLLHDLDRTNVIVSEDEYNDRSLSIRVATIEKDRQVQFVCLKEHLANGWV